MQCDPCTADAFAIRRSGQLPDQNRVNIVIYEEDHLTRALLQEWLGEAGYRVRTGTRAIRTWIVPRIS